MKTVLRCRGLKIRAAWEELIETQVNRLGRLAEISTAHVTLEREQQIDPSFRVSIRLEVPGPDFHADAKDYTLDAALFKVARDLEKQIRSRKTRRLLRRKTNPQLGLVPGTPMNSSSLPNGGKLSGSTHHRSVSTLR